MNTPASIARAKKNAATPPSAADARVDAPTGQGMGEDLQLALLIRLLKMASLISAPMKVSVCDPAEISTNEVKMLMALAGEGALAGHDLVSIMGTPPMNVSRALAGLKGRGWIEDATDPENRRRRPVRLTTAGQAAYATLLPNVANVAGDLLGTMTARQQRDMTRLTDLVLARMEEWEVAHRD